MSLFKRPISPIADSINEQMRAARPSAPSASTPGPVRVSRPMASTPPPILPNYRTDTGFKQTPTPVNPAPRGPIAGTPTPTNPAFRATPPRPTAPAAGMAASARPGLMARMPTLQSVRGGVTAGGVLTGLAEANRIRQNVADGTAGPGTVEAAGTAGRLAASATGAKYAAKLPLPGPLKLAAPAIGAIAGYYAGDAGLDALARVTPEPVKDFIQKAGVASDMLTPGYAAMDAGVRAGMMAGKMAADGKPIQDIPAAVATAYPGQFMTSMQRRVTRPQPQPRPDFSNVIATSSTQQQPTAPAAPAPGDRVLGTFNGRTITQAQADELAGQLPVANSMPAVAGNNFAAGSGRPVPQPEGTTQRVARPVAQVTAPMQDNYYNRQAMETQRQVMNDIDSQLFALRGRGMTFRSGRDAAAQLLATKAGLANAGAGTAAQLSGDDRNTRANVALANAQAQNAQSLQDAQIAGQQTIADGSNRTELEKLALAGRVQRENNLISAQDGTTGVIGADGLFAPVKDAQGRPLRTGTVKRPELSPDKVLEAYGAQLAAIQQNTPEKDRAAALKTLETSPLGQRYMSLLAGDRPPVPGAQQAEDGEWYVTNSDGSFSKVKP